jgi:hypothetical protein
MSVISEKLKSRVVKHGRTRLINMHELDWTSGAWTPLVTHDLFKEETSVS